MEENNKQNTCRDCDKPINKPYILCNECENEWFFEDERQSKHKEE